MRFFRDRRVVLVTERRPLEPSCMRLYTPVPVGGIPSRVRLALAKKSHVLERVKGEQALYS
jgi:hypothetical protein